MDIKLVIWGPHKIIWGPHLGSRPQLWEPLVQDVPMTYVYDSVFRTGSSQIRPLQTLRYKHVWGGIIPWPAGGMHKKLRLIGPMVCEIRLRLTDIQTHRLISRLSPTQPYHITSRITSNCLLFIIKKLRDMKLYNDTSVYTFSHSSVWKICQT